MADVVLAPHVREQREAVVTEHIDAENRHDPDGTVATFSSSKASYDIPAFGEAGQVPDHDSIRKLFVEFFTVFPDLHIEHGPLRHGEDHVLLEARVTGTQRADWLGIPAAGRCMDTRMLALYEFEGDQLVCERVYFDMAQVRQQLEG
jgi:steroid delta-isomerase-like uncharacterized protein